MTSWMYVLIVILAIAADILVLSLWRKKRSQKKDQEPRKFGSIWLLGAPSPALSALRRFYWNHPRLEQARLRILGRLDLLLRWFAPLGDHLRQVDKGKLIGLLAESGFIILWAIWVGRKILDFSPDLIPNGGEFSNLIQTHYIWSLLPRCGLCFLWNGSINGGAPALAEVSGAVLHPLVVIPALLLGINNGAKVTLVAALALAGLAQWGLARALRLGVLARLWSGLISVVSGPLAGRMENGNLGLVLGQACAILVLAYGVDLLFNRNRKALVGFAAAICLMLLSGEGYLQIGLVILLLPILGLFCLKRREPGQPAAWKDFLLAIGLSGLLAGIFLVPLLHFLPQMRKDIDLSLGNYPPLEYIPLNLVIRDLPYHFMDVLGKDRYPYSHIIYIGWIPVLLAFATLRLAPARYNRLLRIFWIGIFFIFLMTSVEAPRYIIDHNIWISQLRHFTVASGFTVPLLLSMAAISLDQLQEWACRWLVSLRVWGRRLPGQTPGILLSRAAVLPLIFFSIQPCYQLGQSFLGLHSIRRLIDEVSMTATPTAQWVKSPIGAFDWVNVALSKGMKVAGTWRPWYLANHYSPMPYIEALRPAQAMVPAFINDLGTAYKRRYRSVYLLHPQAQYAYIVQGDGSAADSYLPCPATSQGGWIDITCESRSAGILTLQEYAWEGWWAWIDGQPARLIPGARLSVQAPAGQHHYRFRYLPWDVLAGALVTLSGVVFAFIFQRKIKQPI